MTNIRNWILTSKIYLTKNKEIYLDLFLIALYSIQLDVKSDVCTINLLLFLVLTKVYQININSIKYLIF
ncbi:hypothetical protein HERIO_1516 [Hepatospora eriocheir]|uniref:Uncharacterized protein n=1 Tax=Hepatospora eriocheir TaxID=1081669 RepID=A0A1X0Q9T1_9MICR|nr:hypothetical protein HERIO_1516 [Hepatospora eriocheir]